MSSGECQPSCLGLNVLKIGSNKSSQESNYSKLGGIDSKYRKVSNISRTKFLNLDAYRLIL